MGLLIPGFTLSWTVAKEVNRPEHSGIATAVVNLGIFLGAGILQPLVGWVLDRGRARGRRAARVGSTRCAILAGARRSARCGVLGADRCRRSRCACATSRQMTAAAPPSIGMIAPVT